jgi:large subunit ribosomal protein L35Ae
MEATIMNFRQGRHTQTNNQMVIKVPGIDTKDKAVKLVGKKVVYTTPAGNKITGEIRSAHGNSGAARVLFEKGMPGQSVSRKVVVE